MPEQLDERILEAAEALFMQYGVRSVTMDDIAKELSISKKTIYQHFKDKEEIVLRVAERVFAKEKQIMNRMHDQGENVIHEMVLISKYLREHVATVNPSALFDLQKFYKDAWEVFQVFQQECLTLIEETIRKGMNEGYFRKAINPKVLSILRSETITLSFNQHLFPREQFDPQEVQTQLFELFVQGMLTDQGRMLYQEYSEKTVLS